MVAEYSTVLATTPQVSYLTNDHLGSPRINTDENRAVTARHDYQPFGEEIATSHRIPGLNYSSDEIRKKFTSYERDTETDFDFAQARMYNKNHGRFTSPDDFRNDSDGNDPQSWNLYVYVRNKPLNATDPTGETGDYYEMSGVWIGSDGLNDNRVYTATVVNTTTNANGVRTSTMKDINLLPITHSEFLDRAATAYGESSAPYYSYGGRDFGELVGEMTAIAFVNQRNNVAYGANNPQAKAFRATSSDSRNITNMQVAIFGVIQSLTGGLDPSEGATHWDGKEQSLIPASDERGSVGGVERHMNTIGWNISDEHYERWKENIGNNFKAPQYREATTGRNKGKARFTSTAVWARTIFWKVSK